MATYLLRPKREIILHRLLGILIEWLALGLLCQGQEKVNQNQCLDQDVPLEGEVAQLAIIS